VGRKNSTPVTYSPSGIERATIPATYRRSVEISVGG
jgi:hypothetical protein